MTALVVLVGLPASGKTSVGAAIAARLGVQFADTDDLVISQDGRSIADIFSDEGERTFRAIESTVVVQALAGFDGVLALGGGAITTTAVRAALKANDAPVLHLTAGTDELLVRVGDTSHRPLLAGDARDRLDRLAVAREPLYGEVASRTVDTAGRSVDQIADDIVAGLSELGTVATGSEQQGT